MLPSAIASVIVQLCPSAAINPPCHHAARQRDQPLRNADTPADLREAGAQRSTRAIARRGACAARMMSGKTLRTRRCR